MSPEDKLRTECYPKARETLEAAVPEGKRGPRMKGRSTNSRISTEAGNALCTVANCTASSKRVEAVRLRPRPHPSLGRLRRRGNPAG